MEAGESGISGRQRSMPASAKKLLRVVEDCYGKDALHAVEWCGVLARPGSTARFAGVFLSCAWPREIGVVVFYIRI
jgi:hypothetical protein